MNLFRFEEITKAPDSPGIYCWYIVPSFFDHDLMQIDQACVEGNAKEKISVFLREKLLKYFVLPKYSVSLTAPLKPTFEGELHHKQHLTELSLERISSSREVLRDLNKFFDSKSIMFFSPVYIGKAKRLRSRLQQHSSVIKKLKNSGSAFEIELSALESEIESQDYAFAKEVVSRGIPLPWLRFSICSMDSFSDPGSYEVIEGLLNRITYPIMGRN